MNNTQNFNVGDIVTCSRRKATLIYKVVELVMETWTQQNCNWKQCSQADVGTQYPSQLRIQSVFDLSLEDTAKKRKVGFRAWPSQCTKVSPQEIDELRQRLDRFLVDAWP